MRYVWRAGAAGMVLALLVGGCGAPAPLKGFWSSSAAACAAGLGVTFRGDSVRARFEGDAFVLLARPRYDVRRTPSGADVRITYALPTVAGGVSGKLGVGIIDLKWSRAEGRLAPVGRRFIDLRTGAASVPLTPDAIDRALALMRCPRRPIDPLPETRGV